MHVFNRGSCNFNRIKTRGAETAHQPTPREEKNNFGRRGTEMRNIPRRWFRLEFESFSWKLISMGAMGRPRGSRPLRKMGAEKKGEWANFALVRNGCICISQHLLTSYVCIIHRKSRVKYKFLILLVMLFAILKILFLPIE